MHFGWLLAKGADWGYLLPLIVMMIYVLSYVFSREGKTQPKGGKPAPRRNPTPQPNMGRGPTPGPGNRPPAGPQQTDPLLAEIQKFLKQSNQGKAAAGRTQFPASKLTRVEPAGSRRGRPAGDDSARPLESLSARHLDTAEVGAGASHLTDDMKRGDLEREQHFEQTFSHKVGSLADTSATGAGAPPVPTAGAATAVTIQTDQPVAPIDWLTLGTGLEELRRAFMLNEILQRPKIVGNAAPSGLKLPRRSLSRRFFRSITRIGCNKMMEKVVPGKTRLGWIGTGVMGSSMCGHLISAGFSMTVFTRTPARAQPLLDRGARWADTPKAVAQASDVVFSIVGHPSDVRSVILGSDGALAGSKKGNVLCDMTTSEPSLAVEIAEAAAKVGVASINAPVSGGDVGAREARLSIMIGGDTNVVEALAPCWQAMGKTIVHQGPAGAGQHTKLVNQILIATNMIGVCEALLYGYRAGLDLNVVLQSVAPGAAGSWSLSNLGPRIIAGNFAPGFLVEHFIKDMGIALAESKRMGLALPGLALAHQLYLALAAQGHGRDGTHALELALAKLSGLDWNARTTA